MIPSSETYPFETDSRASLLSEAQEALRRNAWETATRVLLPGAAQRDAARAPAIHEYAELGKAGLMGLLVPKIYGGRDSGFVGYCLAMEELAAADAGISMAVHAHSIGGTLMIARFGTDEQKKRFLPALASGEQLGAFLLTEPSAGSDAAALRTTAQKDGDHFILDGEKHLITNGGIAGTVVVWAVSDPGAGKKGITAFIVPTRTPGYEATRVEQKMGQHSSDTARVSFRNCRVPAANVLGEEGRGFRLAMSGLVEGRIAIAAQAVGIARAAYDVALRYAHTRHAYGQPLTHLQAISFRLAEMATQIEIARTFYIYAATLSERGVPFVKEASMAKIFAAQMAEQVCSAALQIHGGNGYLRDFTVERLARDARATQLYEGTNDIQNVIIAREILRDLAGGTDARQG